MCLVGPAAISAATLVDYRPTRTEETVKPPQTLVLYSVAIMLTVGSVVFRAAAIISLLAAGLLASKVTIIGPMQKVPVSI